MAEPSGRTVRRNRLAREKSPYLLQHAENPVDWYPWGEEAFSRAKEYDKPVFLSIGYSTCHWCHVMAHESFENEEVAHLLNDTFVCIKVDREERPDIDQVYMKVCQAMTGHGGWPLTIIMTPDKKPFFATSYIPKESRFGVTGLLDLIPRIHQVWTQQRQDIEQSAEKLIGALNTISEVAASDEITEVVLKVGYEDLVGQFDDVYGGFGSAPKFPTPHTLLFLLRTWKRTGEDRALEMVESTLQAVRNGGVYDHVGYGIHRYSTDREWILPHFEKMLYDQALYAIACLEAFQATRKNLYRHMAEEVFAYVLRDMRDSGGAFYAAEDADSEGVEGKFYTWTEEELRDILDDDDFRLAVKVWNISVQGNFTEEATGIPSGRNVLHETTNRSDLAAWLDMDEEALDARISSIRQRLFSARGVRIRPHRDDKVLTDWNGLMVAALARGARFLGKEIYRDAAQSAANFMLHRLRNPEGRLLHRYRDGEAAISGHLDDYAFLIWGLIELYEATFDPGLLKSALDLTDVVLTHFWDPNEGGCFFTADDAEALILRSKEIYDGAVPSGNSVFLFDLLRLSHLTGRVDLDEHAWELARAFAGTVEMSPSGHTMYLSAIDFGLSPVREVAIVGILGEKRTDAMLEALAAEYLPHTVVVLAEQGERRDEVAELIPYTAAMKMIGGKSTAYVCRKFRCSMPVTDVTRMLSLIVPEKKDS